MITVHVEGQNELERKLGNLSRRAPSVMRMALNDTAKRARKDLREEAQKTYKVKTQGFNKDMEMRPATNGNLVAILSSKGSPIPLSKFDYSKNRLRSKNPARAHQLVATVKKPLYRNGNKAFVAKMKSGHLGIFYRNGKKMTKRNKEAISEFYGSTVPSMLGGERVFGKLEPEIQRNLVNNLDRHITRILGGI